MPQQTAVEWLVEQIKEYDFTSTNGVIKIPTWVLTKIKEQAKQMEKEQRINAQIDMFYHMDKSYYGLDYLNKREEAEKYAEDYYTQTYGK